MQMPSGDPRRTILAQMCRGRLVLAMQFWLWRTQAWLHEPSWTSKPEAPVHLSVQEENLRGLCEALHLSDEELLQTSNYLIVVCAFFPAPTISHRSMLALQPNMCAMHPLSRSSLKG